MDENSTPPNEDLNEEAIADSLEETLSNLSDETDQPASYDEPAPYDTPVEESPPDNAPVNDDLPTKDTQIETEYDPSMYGEYAADETEPTDVPSTDPVEFDGGSGPVGLEEENPTDELMEEFGLDTDEKPLDTESSPLTPPTSNSGGGKRLGILIVITAILFLVLLASIWWFFLRDSGGGGGTSTPTPTTLPQPTVVPITETHLECRFGLCVEVPNTPGGDNVNQCASSFDCEQAPLQPTSTPAPDIQPSATATPEATPTTAPNQPTTVPTATPTTTPIQPTKTPTVIPTRVPTATPTPLAGTLPNSGSTETTLLFGLVLIALMGGGFLLLRKETN